jgi:hypothetical protein
MPRRPQTKISLKPQRSKQGSIGLESYNILAQNLKTTNVPYTTLLEVLGSTSNKASMLTSVVPAIITYQNSASSFRQKVPISIPSHQGWPQKILTNFLLHPSDPRSVRLPSEHGWSFTDLFSKELPSSRNTTWNIWRTAVATSRTKPATSCLPPPPVESGSSAQHA